MRPLYTFENTCKWEGRERERGLQWICLIKTPENSITPSITRAKIFEGFLHRWIKHFCRHVSKNENARTPSKSLSINCKPPKISPFLYLLPLCSLLVAKKKWKLRSQKNQETQTNAVLLEGWLIKNTGENEKADSGGSENEKADSGWGFRLG